MNTLAKGLAVLSAFGKRRPAMTLSDAAAVACLSRATARRVLRTLAQLGYVTVPLILFGLLLVASVARRPQLLTNEGIAGALIASLLFPRLGIHLGAGLVSEIIYSAIGAIILLLIVRLVRTGGRW